MTIDTSHPAPTFTSNQQNSALSSILQNSIALRNSQQQIHPTDDQLVQLQRPLDQLEEQTRKLLQKSSKNRDVSSDARAQVLLACHGVDAERIAQTLQEIHIAQTFEPLQPLEDTDVEGYLRNEQEVILSKVIEDMKSQMYEEYENVFERTINESWKNAKNTIFESLSHTRISSTVDELQQQQQQRTPLISSRIVQQQSFLSESSATPMVAKMKVYADVVTALNEARLQNKTPSLARMFGDFVVKVEGIKSEQIRQCWTIVSSIISEPVDASSNLNSHLFSTPSAGKLYPTLSSNIIVRERGFAAAYSAPYDDPEAISLRKKLLNGSRRWLEKLFVSFLDDYVGKILQGRAGTAASTTIKMTPLAKVQLWTREVLVATNPSNYELVDGNAFWAILYYLLRCGEYREALDYAAKYERFLAKSERRFLDYLTCWVTNPDHNLPKKLSQEILHEFNARLRDGAYRPVGTSGSGSIQDTTSLLGAMSHAPLDPFKYLIFRIIGRILTEETQIPANIVKGLPGGRLGWEDDLWLQLLLAREDSFVDDSTSLTTMTSHNELFSQQPSSYSSTDSYSVKDVFHRHLSQTSVSQWTSEGRSPLQYFSVLLLVGEFERAVQFLWMNNCEIDAVHFAICLAFYGLLRIPNEIDSVETEIGSLAADGERVLIHFPRMIHLYLSKLFNKAVHPLEASQYIFLLCLYFDGFFGTAKVSKEAGLEMKKLCYRWLIDLVLETGKVDEFFGTFGVGGVNAGGGGVGGYRQPGFLDKYLPLIGIHGWDDFKRTIIQPAALKAERSCGNYLVDSWKGSDNNSIIDDAENTLRNEQNAIMLYNLAEDYASVLQVLARRITQVLFQNNFEQICDLIFSVLNRSDAIANLPSTGFIERLVAVQNSAESALEYYASRTQISYLLPEEHRKSVNALISLCSVYRIVYEASQAFISQMGTEFGYAKTVNVTPTGAGYRVRLEGSLAKSSEWKKGLSVLDSLGFVPSGLSRISQPRRVQETYSIMETPLKSSLNHNASNIHHGIGRSVDRKVAFASSPIIHSSPSALSNLSPSTATSTSKDLDYSRIVSKADQLRRDFSDTVLAHLPSAFLGAEILILIGWFEGQHDREWESGKRELCRKSRLLISFVSAVTRWFKVPPEIHRRLAQIDEFMLE